MAHHLVQESSSVERLEQGLFGRSLIGRAGGRELPYSWLPPENATEHADELSARGPEAFPD